ncbi:hypothetical protein I4U23_005115 [Adineta vaga]|nr:hypothetical protein I4U23_005115 [Adineta vaga]
MKKYILDLIKTDKNQRFYFGKKLQILLCNWKTFLLIFLVTSYLIISSFYRNEQQTNLDTCADSILNWCKENRIDRTECSWATGTFRNHFYNLAHLINSPYPESIN